VAIQLKKKRLILFKRKPKKESYSTGRRGQKARTGQKKYYPVVVRLDSARVEIFFGLP
jgi:hypothetical protein